LPLELAGNLLEKDLDPIPPFGPQSPWKK